MGGDISLFTSDASSTLPVMNYLALLSASFSSAPVRPHYILFPFFHSLDSKVCAQQAFTEFLRQ